MKVDSGQLPLFPAPLPVHAAAQEAAAVRIAVAARHAERVEPGWNDQAYRKLLEAAASFDGASFTSEQVRQRITIAPPPDKRAWGSVIRRAAVAGRIVRTGYTTDRYASPKPTWRVADQTTGGTP